MAIDIWLRNRISTKLNMPQIWCCPISIELHYLLKLADSSMLNISTSNTRPYINEYGSAITCLALSLFFSHCTLSTGSRTTLYFIIACTSKTQQNHLIINYQPHAISEFMVWWLLRWRRRSLILINNLIHLHKETTFMKLQFHSKNTNSLSQSSPTHWTIYMYFYFY